jgi:tetratricopeptide (TPR) repeat protein
MELVQGAPITDYCDQCNLTTRERLELFITVCQAVQHAHQKGVIHRDIKPTNVLVAIQDGRPAPKIIDFGVAKAINQRLTEQTLATGFAQMIGTPLYMSPEQAELSPLGVDTRSDIYSLGVLLYELLTGSTPFDKERLHSASYDELRRIIREEEPPRPSTRLSSLSLRERAGVRVRNSLPLAGRAGEGDRTREGVAATETAALATTIAAHRRTDPRRLIQSIRGELDWIVMKCLEKDRNRRYATASSLARDIERYLADEPVTACPPSAAYRFRKFYRRNRLAVTAAAFIAVSLVVGFAGTTWGLIRATKAEAIAQHRFEEAEAARQDAVAERSKAEKAAAAEKISRLKEERERNYAQAITQFVVDDFLALTSIEGQDRFGGESIAALHKDTTVSELLNRAAEKLQQRRDLEPQIEAKLCWIIGVNYRGVGDYARAVTFLERSVELLRQELGDEHPDTQSVQNSLAVAYEAAGQIPKAIALSEQLGKATAKTLGADHRTSLKILDNLAWMYHDAGKLPEAIALYEKVKEAQTSSLGAEHPDTLSTLHGLATAYSAVGRKPEAIALYEQVRDARLKMLGPDHRDTLETLGNLADTYREVGNLSLAIALLEQVKDAQIAKLGVAHPNTLITLVHLASAYRQAGNLSLAIALFEQVRDEEVRINGPHHPHTLWTLHYLALAYRDAGRLPEAIGLLEQVCDTHAKVLAADHPDALHALGNLALAYRDAGRLDEAIALHEQVRDAKVRTLGPDHSDTLNTLGCLAVTYWSAGHLDRSIPLFESLLKKQEAKLGRGQPETQLITANLGVNYKDAGRIAEAIPFLEEAYRAAKEHSTLGWVKEPLLDAYIAAGRSQDASRLSIEILADIRHTLPPKSPELASELARLGRMLLRVGAYDGSEPLVRECLALREKLAKEANDESGAAVRPWQVANAKSLLGGVLIGQAGRAGHGDAQDKLLAEAEPMLIAGWEGLKAAADLTQTDAADPGALPEASRHHLSDTLDRLIELYSLLDKRDEVNKWQAEKAKLAPAAAQDQTDEAVENKTPHESQPRAS